MCNPELRVGGWLASRFGGFTPAKDPVPIVKEARWASDQSGRHTESRLQPDSVPGPPALSKLLYQLRYPGRLRRIVT